MKEILLDENIRNFATIPIFVITILASAIRQNIAASTKPKPKTSIKDAKLSNIRQRCQRLRANATYLTESSFTQRREFLCKTDGGLLWSPPESNSPFDAFFKQDASQTSGMLKGQMAFLFLQGGLGFFVNYLYSGFLVAKAPFPLTFRFKSMLQRGIDVALLDVSYVSSLSWYFFVMVTSGGFVMIINWLLSRNDEEIAPLDPSLSGISSLTGMPAMGMGGSMGAQPDAQYKEERNALQVLAYNFALSHIESSLLKSWS